MVETSGDLDMKTGSIQDNVRLVNHSAIANTSIRTAGGSATLSIENSFFDSSVAVRTSGAVDRLTVSYAGFDGAAQLFNDQGSGNDQYTDGNGFYTGHPT